VQQVDVLPLVDNIKRYDSVINDYKRGWCTYYYEFDDVPEVEFFCGGVNEKTPRASALWRQGNLLHFGFEQSPAEMNATGRAMLVNAIVYISRFTEDRPIGLTPSVFGSEPIATTRRRAGYFTDAARFPDYRMEWLTNVFSSAALKSFNWRDRTAATAWFQEARPWLLLLPGGSESLQGLAVTSDYFRVLGIQPALGRTFVDADGHPSADESSPISRCPIRRSEFFFLDVTATDVYFSNMAQEDMDPIAVWVLWQWFRAARQTVDGNGTKI